MEKGLFNTEFIYCYFLMDQKVPRRNKLVCWYAVRLIRLPAPQPDSNRISPKKQKSESIIYFSFRREEFMSEKVW